MIGRSRLVSSPLDIWCHETITKGNDVGMNVKLSHRIRRFFALEIENRRIFEGSELNRLKSAILITRLNLVHTKTTSTQLPLRPVFCEWSHLFLEWSGQVKLSDSHLWSAIRDPRVKTELRRVKFYRFLVSRRERRAEGIVVET